MSIYTEYGFESRDQYLESLSEDFGVDIDIIQELSDILGHEEDFDGLVSELEDFSHYN